MKLLSCVLWFLERWENEDFASLTILCLSTFVISMSHMDWQFIWFIRINNSYEFFKKTHIDRQFVWVIRIVNSYKLYGSPIPFTCVAGCCWVSHQKCWVAKATTFFIGWYFSRVASNMWCNLGYFLHLQLFHVGSGYYTYVFPKYTRMPPLQIANYPLYSFS